VHDAVRVEVSHSCTHLHHHPQALSQRQRGRFRFPGGVCANGAVMVVSEVGADRISVFSRDCAPVWLLWQRRR
jgi:hypothetical protein